MTDSHYLVKHGSLHNVLQQHSKRDQLGVKVSNSGNDTKLSAQAAVDMLPKED